MYTTQCVPLEGFMFRLPISDSNEPPLKEMPKTLKDQDERTCWAFIFDVAFFKFFFYEQNHWMAWFTCSDKSNLRLVINKKSPKTLSVFWYLSNRPLS